MRIEYTANCGIINIILATFIEGLFFSRYCFKHQVQIDSFNLYEASAIISSIF